MRAIAAALAVVSPAVAQQAVVKHAIGTFQVTITPEESAPAPVGGLPTARMGLTKIFTGDLIGVATGTMLSAGTPKPRQVAVYVAIDQVLATLDGRHGGFILVHRGEMDGKGGGDFNVSIAPGSGTDGLTGIAGTLTITIEGGVHRYDLAYTLPAAK